MKNTKKKSGIAVTFLMLTIVSFTASIPMVYSADYESFAFINVSPNPVGVRQSVIVLFWLSKPTPTAQAGYHPEYNWNNYTVTITSPSGAVENFGPYTSDATGGAYFSYTPTEVGDYTFQFTFPGQTIEGVGVRGQPVGPITFGPANASTILTVQEEQIVGYQTPPLPTDYWTRPVYGENRGWYQISGNWLSSYYNNTGAFNPYTTAPNTAHIVWTKQINFGGVVGGEYEDLNYYSGPTYQPYWNPPLIINGRLYYMERLTTGDSWIGLHCVDIRTGREQWFTDAETIGYSVAGGGSFVNTLFGQILDAEGPNGHGAFAFIWNLGANYTCFDANSGEQVYEIINCLPATWTFNGGLDSHGSIITYTINTRNGWLLKWNSTKAMLSVGLPTASHGGTYLQPRGQSIDWTTGIEWNVTIPTYPGLMAIQGGNVPLSDGKVLFASTGSLFSPTNNITLIAYSAIDGQELWTSDLSESFVKGDTTWTMFGPLKDGVFTVHDKSTNRWWGYDEYTGEKLWGPTESYEDAWDMQTPTMAAGYGKFYVGTCAGNIYAHDLKTGDLEWVYNLPPSGYDTPYGAYPLYSNRLPPTGGITVADGKIYAITGEHTPNSPYWLGGAMYCINATTGDLVCKMPGWWSDNPAIADGYALNHNCYDGQIYCFGKGKTATTVEAPLTGIPLGTSVMIRGTVMDQSLGALDYAGNRLNPEGTPAIADEYMTEWMEYLHQQKPMPDNVEGVEGVNVFVKILDPNGDWYSEAVTSDANGVFSLSWAPAIVGDYHVTAMFEGSESYYTSQATTTFTVDESQAAGVPSAEEIADTTVNRMPAYPAIPEIPAYLTIDLVILIIAAVGMVIGLIAYMALRKQK
jgi:outer membrane protein assembly factor BamB/RES domain-containing protein